VTSQRKTALFDEHRALGGDMESYEWSGMAMPWTYRTSLAEEQRAVRERVGLADVSQLRVVRVIGPDAESCIEELVPRPIRDMSPGTTRFSVVLSRFGRILDEALIMRLAADEFWISHGCGGAHTSLDKLARDRQVRVDFLDDMHVLSVQGPASKKLLVPLGDGAAGGVPYLGNRRAELAGKSVLLSRSGFTGELGFEIFCDREDVVALWNELREAGAALGLRVYGYRCIDLLRIEAGFTLYPTDLAQCRSIWEAGLGWLVRGKEESFVGSEAVFEARGQAEYRFAGAEFSGERQLGFRAELLPENGEAGIVTSSAFSPSCEATLAIVRVGRDVIRDGAEVVCRGEEEVVGRLCTLPFRQRRTGD